MTAPSQETAERWIGQPVHDSYGNVLGTCAAILADDLVGDVEWLDVQRPEGEHCLVPAQVATQEASFVRVAVAAYAVAGAPVTSAGVRPDEHERARLHTHYGTAAPRPVRQQPPAAAPQGSSLAPRLLPALGAAAAAGLGFLLVAALAARVLRGGAGVAPTRAAGPRRAPAPRPAPSRRARPSRQGRSSGSSSPGLGRAAAGLTAAASTRAASGARTAAASTGRKAARAGTRAVRTGVGVSTRARRAVTPSRRRSARLIARAFVAGRRSATTSQRWRGGAVSAVTVVTAPVIAAVTTITTLWRISVGIIKNALVFGGGYVVGSRAGRERYQQLKQQGSALLERPGVQHALQRAKGVVTGGASTAVDRVKGKIGSSQEGHDEASERSSTSSSAPSAGPAGPAVPASPTPGPTGTSTEAGVSDAELDALTKPDATPSGTTPSTGRASGRPGQER